ncbi:MAG: zinc ribbon domain-containing protein [Thermoanaerobacteraceae bacterium]|nr:zinc ribbon domain-containing protein [Thermoanaerobacteraceae bacterium]
MPIYDFRCEDCGHKFTLLMGISERDKVTCPRCGSKKVSQLITGCAVQVKGGGCGGGRTGSGSAGG